MNLHYAVYEFIIEGRFPNDRNNSSHLTGKRVSASAEPRFPLHRTQGVIRSGIFSIYAIPSVEMMRKAMEQSDSSIPNEPPLWPDDEAEIARLCGIR